MNVLLITTFFPPDTTIANVRAFMFAKHLAAFGENVTVLRSGEFELAPFDEYERDNSFEVLSALGKNSDAEKFERGEYSGFQPTSRSRFHSLPRLLRKPVKAVKDTAKIITGTPPKCIRHQCCVLKYQKRLIDRLYSAGRRFDVVFSTCGSVENIYAGKYAAQRFGAKWIMDFRDSMIMKGEKYDDMWWNLYAKKATLCALENADCITAVSVELAKELKDMYASANVKVLYNGFDDTQPLPEVAADRSVLSFCYTGRVYEAQISALNALAKCLAELIKSKKINSSKIIFNYAGSSFDAFETAFAKAGISDILVNKGYLSKSDTFILQLESDIHTVLSWNTNNSRGILTGKFYEGIKAGKPVLALLAGDTPNSELLQLQRQYGYGFCYENCTQSTSMPQMKEYITKLYREKMTRGKLSYAPSKELYDAFGYTHISRKLDDMMHELTAQR